MLTARTRALLTLGATVLAVLPGVSRAAPEETVGLLAYRTTTRAASLQLQVDAVPGDRPAVVASVFATVERGRITKSPDGSVMAFGAGDRARVTVDGNVVRLCDHGVCAVDGTTTAAGMGLTVTNRAGETGVNVVLLTVRAPRVTYRVEAKGWAVKRVPTSFRWVGGDGVALGGSYALGHGVEAFSDASAPGGRFGSVGIATAPCSQSTTGVVSRGVGTITLDGGRTRPSLTCPTSDNTITSWADAATEWQVSGTAFGDTTLAEARLFVQDLPRKLATPSNWPWR